jgi:DNA-binding transcriptional LysR family regulator
MELRTLAYVEAVARLGSFTAAARELHVAQPAVSAQVAQAERALGTRLFVRSHHRTTPTEAGALVAARARRLSAEMTRLRADVDRLNGLLTGTLRIGATPLLGPVDLPQIAARFQRAHPGVALHVQVDLVDALLHRLADGDLDVVLGPVTARTRTAFNTRLLHEETVVLIAAPDLTPSLTRLADAADLPFVCLGPTSGLRRILDAAGDRAGFTPHVTTEVADPQQVRAFVAAGLGVALIAKSVASAAGPAVTITELSPAPAHPPLGLVTRRQHDHAPTTAFIAEVTGVGRRRAHPPQ